MSTPEGPTIPVVRVSEWLTQLDLLVADVSFGLDKHGVIDQLRHVIDDMQDATP